MERETETHCKIVPDYQPGAVKNSYSIFNVLLKSHLDVDVDICQNNI